MTNLKSLCNAASQHRIQAQTLLVNNLFMKLTAAFLPCISTINVFGAGIECINGGAFYNITFTINKQIRLWLKQQFSSQQLCSEKQRQL